MRLSREEYLKLFIPRKKEIYILITLVLITFIVFEINLILFKLTQNTIFSEAQLQESFVSQIRAFFDENKIANTITLVLFWGSMGLIVYSVVWSIYSVYNEAKNELEVENEYINQISKQEKNNRRITQLGIVAGIVVLGIFTLWLSAPFAISLWTSGISQLPDVLLGGIIQIIAGFILLTMNFYLFKVLIDWMLVLE